MEETKNAELAEEKEKKLRSKNLIIHGVEVSSTGNKDDAIKSDDIYINNSIAALKLTSTVKSASKIDLPAQDKNPPIKVVMNAMNTKEERNMILSNLKNLKGIPEYKAISVTENYTITERQMMKDWSDKPKGKNKNESLGSKFVWRVRGSPKKLAATQEVPEADTSNRLELSHGKKVFKQLQNIEEADRDKNSKKSLNRDRMIYPLSKFIPAINIMYNNADQVTTMKMSVLLEFVERKKPHIISICEVTPRIPREQAELDYVIPGYSSHPSNLNSSIERGIIYSFFDS